MAPSPYSDGPPLPPEARQDAEQPPPVPPSIIAQQGAQGNSQDGGGPPPGGAPQAGGPTPGGQPQGGADMLQKQTLAMGLQKLLEFKNSIESLIVTMKAIDPESVALFIPAIEVGKAIESRLQQTMQRAANPSPSMAGMQGGAGPQPRPSSAAGL